MQATQSDKALKKEAVVCEIHPGIQLVCPKCLAAKGGRKTATEHAEKMSDWGKLGGRPKKKAAPSTV